MQRHAALQSLSHDHHHGLVQAHRLSQLGAQSLDAEKDRIARDFLAFWEADGERHFQEEESVLLPIYARRGDARRPECTELLQQHVEIRRDVWRLRLALADGAPLDGEAMAQLGRALQAHIRFEERTVFPLIEAALTEAGLALLGRLLHSPK